jgi:hypothetical protein
MNMDEYWMTRRERIINRIHSVAIPLIWGAVVILGSIIHDGSKNPEWHEYLQTHDMVFYVVLAAALSYVSCYLTWFLHVSAEVRKRQKQNSQ